MVLLWNSLHEGVARLWHTKSFKLRQKFLGVLRLGLPSNRAKIKPKTKINNKFCWIPNSYIFLCFSPIWCDHEAEILFVREGWIGSFLFPFGEKQATKT